MSRTIGHRVSQIRIRHLALLDLLMEHRSLRKAAESLGISEPTASQMVRDMEAMFGQQLFKRGRRGMTPNQMAEALHKRGRVVLRETQAMEEDLRDFSDGLDIVFYLGALPRCMHGLIPTTLADLYQNHFRARVHVMEGSSTQLLSALDQGDLDIAVTRLLDEHGNPLADSRFNAQVLYEEGMSIICSNGHELASDVEVKLADLSGFSWVLPSAGSVTRKLIETEFLNVGLTPPRPTVECAISASQLSVVRTGHFLGICPSSIAQEWQQQKLLRVVQVKLKVPLPPIVAAWHQTKNDEPSIMSFKAALLRSVRPRKKARQ